MCCFVVPMTCCGPPVIYASKPMCCCCIDVTSCFGESIGYAPCNCYGMKKYLCCGGPCYMFWGSTMFCGISNGKKFLAQWGGALTAYWTKTGLDASERAIFEEVKDSEFDHNSAQTIAT